MKPLFFVFLAVFLCLAVNTEAAKKKKKSKKSSAPKDDSKMFDPKTLKCLVCQNVIQEFEAAIWRIDPKKMIDTGTFRSVRLVRHKNMYVIFCCHLLFICYFLVSCCFDLFLKMYFRI